MMMMMVMGDDEAAEMRDGLMGLCIMHGFQVAGC